jgi:hypothetical protein
MIFETLNLVQETKSKESKIKITKNVIQYIIYLALWLGTVYISLCKNEPMWTLFILLFGIPAVFLYLAKDQIINCKKYLRK